MKALVSMFQNPQADNDLNKARETYDTYLQKGKELGLNQTSWG